MPEGHLIHHYARKQARWLRGRVAVESPQGRFAEEAAQLDGGDLRDVEAYGKHLFYRWGDARVVHAHLGMQGIFLHHPAPAPAPRPQVRMRLAAQEMTVDLIAPARCELVDEAGRADIVSRLGPDPLRSDADPEVAWDQVRRSRRPIGALMLDQGVVAGVGNVLRAEALHLAGLHPDIPANSISRPEFERLWGALARMMEDGATIGRVITVELSENDDHVGRPDAELRRVYKRERCYDCGALVESWDLGGREIYACPVCQPYLGQPPHDGRPAASSR